MLGQPPDTPPKIVVRDKKDGTNKTYDGNLKFGPTGFQIVSADNKKVLATIAPGDLVKYTPGELPGLERGIVLAQISLEDKKTKKDYETAKLGYEDMRKKSASVPEPSKRYLDFKIAMMATKVADESADDEGWATLADAAAKTWTGFLGDYKTGWEVWPAAKTNARLLVEVHRSDDSKMNKYDEIARLWRNIAKTAELPTDLKAEATIQEIDAQMRTGKGFPQTQAEAAAAAAAPGPTKDQLEIYVLAAKGANDRDYAAKIKEIEEKIEKTKDATVRGVGYGMIGELQLLAGKPRDAMWAFLWVETVYNADRDDAFKAMCRLVEVFRAQGDEDRVKSYREKIRRTRSNF